MRPSHPGTLAGLAVLLMACTPLVRTHTRPHGPGISANCFKVEAGVLVRMSLPRAEGSPAWTAEFIGDAPDRLTVEELPALTLLTWTLDPGRAKAASIPPYRLTLRQGDLAYETTLSFRSNAQQVMGALVLAIPRH